MTVVQEPKEFAEGLTYYVVISLKQVKIFFQKVKSKFFQTQQEASEEISFDSYSPENQLHYRWFRGKCLLDRSWC